LCLQLKPKASGAAPAIADAGKEVVITVSDVTGQTWTQTIMIPEVRCANQYLDMIY
jgi:Neuraminidase (sialidase)